MANAIQIKRRNSGNAGPPSSLKAGELAYNNIDATLYYGAGDNGSGVATAIIAIGGPGTFAQLNGPAFTGVPSAPTAAGGTNTQQLATTAFVAAAISSLINGSPGALDTLKELADAIGDDANFASTITNSLSYKAPLASPALTGTPTAPTPAVDTNTTQIPTTAWVLAQLASTAPAAPGTAAVGTSTRMARADHVHPQDASKAPLASPAFTGTPSAPTQAQNDNSTNLSTTAYADRAAASSNRNRTEVSDAAYTATATDRVVSFTALTAARVVTLPAASAYPKGATLQIIDETGACSAVNTITINRAGSDTINGVNSAVLANPYGFVSIESNGVGKWTIVSQPQVVQSVAGRQGAVTLGITDVSGAAPSASPTFTGTPSAPTPALGDNSTKVATTAFTAAAVTNGTSGLAPKASPALTGTPTAPTAAAGDNSTTIATTAFVQAAVGAATGTTAIDGGTF